ncbi:MAG: ATPase, T2SS/T4P/T4SS family [Solirubrobacteraceae bacterium]
MNPATAAPPGLTPPTQRGRSPRRIGEVVVALEYATEEQVEHAVALAQQNGRSTGRVLLDDGVLTSDQLARVVAERFGLDHVDLSMFPVDMAAANMLGPQAARRYGAVPIGRLDDRTLLVAMADPANVLAMDDIAMMSGMEVTAAIAAPEDIEVLVSKLNRFDEAVQEAVQEQEEVEEDPAGVEVLDGADEAPVIKLVHSIIAQAIEQGASDIHLAAEGGELVGQLRVDGVLAASLTVPKKMVSGVVSRIKIMAELDIAERRRPQDGRFGMTLDGRSVDVRVVTLPLVGGESVVMRLLDRASARIGLDQLGMRETERDRFVSAAGQPYGAVLVTGPTGSGKSTTLYAALNLLNTGDRSILTIEDPVEYRIAGLKQMQVNKKAGVTFASGLRAALRADPDVVMVGEVRDDETARISIEAALTGHLVLTTLHTNDAPTAITRLIEMGVEPFLVASAIDCVVAQRLARRLCDACKQEQLVDSEALRANGFDAESGMTAWEPKGCPRCAGTGYKGRVGLYEVMTVTEEIRSLALQRRPADAVAEVAAAEGMARLRDDGIAKVRDGVTSLAEVARVAGTA